MRGGRRSSGDPEASEALTLLGLRGQAQPTPPILRSSGTNKECVVVCVHTGLGGLPGHSRTPAFCAKADMKPPGRLLSEFQQER